VFARVASSFAFGVLGLGFIALVVFEVRLGIAGAKFGAADVHTHPGTFAFLIAMQAFLAIVMFASAIGAHITESRTTRRIAIVPIAAILLLFVWTIVEISHDMLSLGATMSLSDRFMYGGLGVVLLIVMTTIGYQFIWLEIRDRLR
jgi:hypothetical protein